MRDVEATANSVFALGAKLMVVWLASPVGVSKAVDDMLPKESLVEL